MRLISVAYQCGLSVWLISVACQCGLSVQHNRAHTNLACCVHFYWCRRACVRVFMRAYVRVACLTVHVQRQTLPFGHARGWCCAAPGLLTPEAPARATLINYVPYGGMHGWRPMSVCQYVSDVCVKHVQSHV